MTEAEMLELYGQVPLKFSSYYKYVFEYVGRPDHVTTIRLLLGGSADDIYRLDVNVESPLLLADVMRDYSSINISKIIDAQDVLIYSAYQP